MVVYLITLDLVQAVKLMAPLEVQVGIHSLPRNKIALSPTSLEDQDGKLMLSLSIMNVCKCFVPSSSNINLAKLYNYWIDKTR